MNDLEFYELEEVEVYPNVYWHVYYTEDHLVVYDQVGNRVDDLLLQEFEDIIKEQIDLTYDHGSRTDFIRETI